MYYYQDKNRIILSNKAISNPSYVTLNNLNPENLAEHLNIHPDITKLDFDRSTASNPEIVQAIVNGTTLIQHITELALPCRFDSRKIWIETLKKITSFEKLQCLDISTVPLTPDFAQAITENPILVNLEEIKINFPHVESGANAIKGVNILLASCPKLVSIVPQIMGTGETYSRIYGEFFE